jgi:outer membrane receptor protein involved in Fe transport
MRFLRLALIAALLTASAISLPARAAEEASLRGSVVDTAGAPLAGASVSLHPGQASTRTDAQGRFEIGNLAAQSYDVFVTRPGYVSATYAGVFVGATGTTLDVRLASASLSTLQQIASVRTQAYGSFNTSASALQNLSQQNFVDQGQLQIGHVLDQVPGVVSARPGSGNAAVPGSITSPNLRGALDYEKSTLIDGFPLINGSHGDYPTMFVNSLLFDDVEVVKGPTAFAPEINYGIGGTLNFRTGNPTAKLSADVLYGVDFDSGSFANVRFADTLGKFGFYIDLASYGTQGPLQNAPTYVTPGAGWAIGNFGTLATAVTSSKNPNPTYVKGFPSNQFTSLVACCQNVTSNYLNKGEVGKLQYHFSNATVLTAGFIGIQASYDGAASSLTQFGSTFAPAPGFASAAFSPGQNVLVNNSAMLPDRTLLDNEPMFEAELRSTIGNDTVLGRFYNAILDRRTVSDLTNPAANYTVPVTVWGSASLCTAAAPCVAGSPPPPPTIFDGTHTTLTIPTPYFQTVEHDILRGLSFEYDHPVAENLYTFAVDGNTGLTNAYTVTGSATIPGGKYSTSIAAGTKQIFMTYLARGTFQLGDKTQLTLANYFNTYNSTYTAGPPVAGVFPLTSSTTTHDDPRLGLSYRASRDLNVRFSAGSSIAPPYPSLIDTIPTTPAQVYTPTSTTLTITQNSGNLKPETSWGYDLGADWRFSDGSVLSADTYLTNIWNQFVGVVYPTKETYMTLPVYVATNANLAQSRYQGIEATLTKDPRTGWGYVAAFDLQRAYAYDISPGFYTSAAGPFTTNLGVVDGINYQGFNAPFFNGVSNKSEAYSMGYAALHHRGSFGQYAELGLTYYGSNNTYNIPAFMTGTATYRQPIDPNTDVQISADNLFGANDASYVLYGAGIPTPLANGGIGIRQGVPYGPATFRVFASRHF